MKKLAPYLIAGIAVLLALILGAQSCYYKGKVAKLDAQRIERENIEAVNAELHAKLIAGLNAEIQRQDKVIQASAQAVAGLNSSIGAKDARLQGLGQDLAAAKTDAERVPILTAQVKVWSDKFTLAESIIAEKDAQLTAWAVKYADAVTIGESWKARYEGQVALYKIAASEISALKGSLRTSRLFGTVKSGLILGAAGYIGYTLLKGK